MNKTASIGALFFLCFSASSMATDCRFGVIETVTATIHSSNPVAESLASCKIDPNDPTMSILATPFIVSENDIQIDYDLNIFIAHSKTGNVISRLRQGVKLQSDSYKIEAIAIDTGRYDLAVGVKAFGVI